MGFVQPVRTGLVEDLGVALDPRGNVRADTRELHDQRARRVRRRATAGAGSRSWSGRCGRVARPRARSTRTSRGARTSRAATRSSSARASRVGDAVPTDVLIAMTLEIRRSRTRARKSPRFLTDFGRSRYDRARPGGDAFPRSSATRRSEAAESEAAYDLDRLERAVAALIDGSRAPAPGEPAAARAARRPRSQRIQALEAELRHANQRRQDIAKRIDELIAQIDQLDAQLGRRGASA